MQLSDYLYNVVEGLASLIGCGVFGAFLVAIRDRLGFGWNRIVERCRRLRRGGRMQRDVEAGGVEMRPRTAAGLAAIGRESNCE